MILTFSRLHFTEWLFRFTEQKMVFHVFFNIASPWDTIKVQSRCRHASIALAKLIKRIPLRFTQENQISFPFCSVKPSTQGLRNDYYSLRNINKKWLSMFYSNIASPWDTIKVRSHCRHASIALAKLIKRIPLRFTRENQISFPFCSVKASTQGLRND